MGKDTLTGITNVCVFTCQYIGAASKRFGIDGEREAVPLMLDLMYNRVRNCLILHIQELHKKTHTQTHTMLSAKRQHGNTTPLEAYKPPSFNIIQLVLIKVTSEPTGKDAKCIDEIQGPVLD